MKSYIFGHSLIVHTPPSIPTPSDETTVPHWMEELSNAAGYGYTADGQYGFLRNHADLPPTDQWSFDQVPSGWNGSFGSSNFTTVMLTAANFIQYQPVTTPYDGSNPSQTSPLDATLNIVDWVSQQEPSARIVIYENWPDMSGYVSSFPASAQEFSNYNRAVNGDFHDWWIDYHDRVRSARPNANVKMVPVGPIISKLLTDTNLSQIPFTDLYEDDAPHGRPTIYFLASLVTYMATYGVQPPADFQIPNTVNSLVQSNYSATVNFIWDELHSFEDSQGNSRVF